MCNNVCRTCFKPLDHPYRLYDSRGKVIQGCVSKDHDGALVAGSESSRWHNRPESKALRRADKTWTLAQCEARGLAVPR